MEKYIFRRVETKTEKFTKMEVKHVHLTQSSDYGLWQEALTREVFSFELCDQEKNILISGQYIAYPLINGRSYWYAPYGPIIADNVSKDAVATFVQKIKKEAQEHQAVFVRHEIPSQYHYKKTSQIISEGSYTQPRHEWHIDVTQPESDILKEMEQKTRYNIKLAEKKGLIPVIDTTLQNEEHKETFLKLMELTSSRNSFKLHDRKYYETILNTRSIEIKKTLILLYKETTPLAGNLLITYGDTTHYLFGGSSDTHKNLMGSYLIQWIGIKEARRLGSRWYSLGALLGEKENKKSWIGITHFKKRFGGSYDTHPPLHDDILHYPWYVFYILYRVVSKIKNYF